VEVQHLGYVGPLEERLLPRQQVRNERASVSFR